MGPTQKVKPQFNGFFKLKTKDRSLEFKKKN